MTISEAVTINNSLAVQSLTGATRSSIAQETLQVYPLEFVNMRVWDAFQTSLSAAAAADDLGLATGTFATSAPYLTSRDLNALGATTGYARILFTLPTEYSQSASVALRLYGGMLTSVASVSATVDAEVYRLDKDTTIGGSDLVTTAATSINSTSFAAKDFSLTYSGLAPGDVLDIRLAIAANSATASSHFAAIASAEMLLTVRG